jgi:hypothetical protein
MRLVALVLLFLLGLQAWWYSTERQTRRTTLIVVDALERARSLARTCQTTTRVRLCMGQGKAWLRIDSPQTSPVDIDVPHSVLVVAPADGASFSQVGQPQTPNTWLVVNSITGSTYRVSPTGNVVRARPADPVQFLLSWLP